MTKQFRTIDVTKHIAKALDKAGFGDDSNKETDITKAGMFDVMDALSGKDNSKFTKEQASKEFNRRMNPPKKKVDGLDVAKETGAWN